MNRAPVPLISSFILHPSSFCPMTQSSPNTRPNVPPSLVAIAGWLLPGSGYWLLGERKRGMIVGITILSLYVAGLLVAGVRVIEVPGYDRVGNEVRIDIEGRRIDPDSHAYAQGTWALTPRGWV